MKPKDGIAIVGMDCRYPGANNIQEYWENILSLRQEFRPMPEKRLDLKFYGSDDKNQADTTYVKKAAVLTGYNFDRIKYRVSKLTFDQTDLAQWLALDVAAGVLKDAGFENGIGLDKERTGVIIGNSLNGEFTRANVMRLRWPYVLKVLESTLSSMNYGQKEINDILKSAEKAYKQPFPVPNADTLAGGLSNTIAGRICNYFDFTGGGYTIDGACSSSLLALANGCNAIANNDLDTVLVGGVDLSIDPFELVGFARNGALADTEMEVFSNKPQGFWPGEGCGIALIMKESEAINRGLHIYSIIRGWGISSDGKGGISRPKSETQQLAIERACKRAGYDVGSVAMFEAHGTGTPLGDEVELTALVNAIRSSNSKDDFTPVVGSVKHLIGHTKAAAGIAGVIKASLSINNRIIPGMKRYQGINSVLKENPEILKLADKPHVWGENRPMRASVSSFGFGGINVHITLEGSEKANLQNTTLKTLKPYVEASRDHEIFPISATSKEALVTKLKRLRNISMYISRAEFIDLSVSMTNSFKNIGNWKVSLVADVPDNLLKSIELLINSIEANKFELVDYEKGIYFNGTGQNGQIAFLFPGQGSPIYQDKGAFSEFSKELLNDLAISETKNIISENSIIDTAIAQPEIVNSTVESVRFLQHFGIEADYGIGHSLGEISALQWAGVISEKDAINIAQVRGEAMSSKGKPNGSMLALKCSEQELQAVITDCNITITGFNGKDNFVIGGETVEVEKVAQNAFEQNIQIARLKVSHAFHTPMMSEAAEQFKNNLNEYSFHTPIKNIISTVTGRIFDKHIGVDKHLYEQIEKPVLFTQAINEIRKQVKIYIEVGPGKTLTKSLANDTDIKVIPVDFGSSNIKGFLSAISASFIAGQKISFEGISANRFSRPIDVDNWELKVLESPCEQIEHNGSFINEIVHDRQEETLSAPRQQKENIQVEGGTRESVLHFVKDLISKKTEIPIEVITDDDRIMSQLHLNSLTITEIVSLVAKAFNKNHMVFSAASILANADGTIKELSNLIFEGESGATKSNKGKINMDVLPNWTHIFKRKNIRKKKARVEINNGPGNIIVKGTSSLIQDWESLLAQSSLAVGNGGIFVYGQDTARDQLNDFIDFLNMPEVMQADFVVLVEISSEYITGDLKPILRSFKQEWPQISALAIQFDKGVDEKLELLIDEIKTIPSYKEVSYKNQKERDESEFEVFFPNVESLADVITKDDVILATGGGKGITFESIFSLASATKAKVAIIGRSKEEQDADLSKNLEMLKVKGIDFKYYSADVCNAKDIQEVMRRVYSDLGSINVIIHGAGLNTPKRIQQLTPADFEKTLKVKVEGLKNVVQATDLASLKLLIGYGSIIAQSGMQGNADYAWANDQLALYIDELGKKNEHCRCITMEWSVWEGTGMGVSLNSISNLKGQGVWPIPISQGVEKLESLIADKNCGNGRFVVSGRYGEIPTLTYTKNRLPLGRFISKIKNHVPQIELISEIGINLKEDIYLQNHVFKGQYVFPTVMILEGIAQCCNVLKPHSGAGVFQNLKINKSIFIPKDKNNTIRIIVTRTDENNFKAIVQSEDSNFEINCFECTINYSSVLSIQIDPLDESTLKELDFNVQERFYDDLLFHSGPFRRISSFYNIHALTSLAKTTSNLTDAWYGQFLPQENILGDPGLNDAAIHCHQASRPSQQLLPTFVEEISISHENIEGPFYIKTSEKHELGNETTIDVHVFNKNGEVKQYWKGLVLTRVSGAEQKIKWTPFFLVPYLEYSLNKLGEEKFQLGLGECKKLVDRISGNSSDGDSIEIGDFRITLEQYQLTAPESASTPGVVIELENYTEKALLQINNIKEAVTN